MVLGKMEFMCLNKKTKFCKQMSSNDNKNINILFIELYWGISIGYRRIYMKRDNSNRVVFDWITCLVYQYLSSFRHMKLELLKNLNVKEGACTLCFDQTANYYLSPCNHRWAQPIDKSRPPSIELVLQIPQNY